MSNRNDVLFRGEIEDGLNGLIYSAKGDGAWAETEAAQLAYQRGRADALIAAAIVFGLVPVSRHDVDGTPLLQFSADGIDSLIHS